MWRENILFIFKELSVFSWIESDIIYFLLLVLVFFLHSIPLINWHVKGNFLNHFPLPPFYEAFPAISPPIGQFPLSAENCRALIG